MAFSAQTNAEPSDKTARISLESVPSKPKRGRPPALINESQRRKRRNISVSDAAWKHIEELAENLGYSSKSDLLERIGKGELTISRPNNQVTHSSLSEILIYRRLQGMFNPHSDVLHSLFAFNFAIYQKLKPLQGKPFNELMVEDVLAAISVVFQHCYIRPDRYVNSLSSLTRLINYCLLLNQADLENSWPLSASSDTSEALEPSNGGHEYLTRIGNAMSHLRSASFSIQLTALRLKYISGFTEAQIQQTYRLQGMDFTVEEIRRLVHEGWATFRSHWSTTTKIKNPVEAVKIPPEATKYCELLWASSLDNAKDRHDLLRILLRATYDAPLNFWLCEIEHKWSTEILGQDKKREQEFSQLQTEIQSRLNEKLQTSKDILDKEMHYCPSRADAVEKLADIFEKETNISQTTQLGTFMVRLLQGEAEERFAITVLNSLKRGHKDHAVSSKY